MGDKTSPSVQFVELVRQGAARLKLAQNGYSLYCEHCRRQTDHDCQPAGLWEIYRCALCGSVQKFKVK